MQLSKFKNYISGPVIEKFETETNSSSIKDKTILLIDDEAIVTDICEMMLKRYGHKVLKDHGRSEGLELYEANKSQIDLIIFNLNRPEMNGQEVVDNLRIS